MSDAPVSLVIPLLRQVDEWLERSVESALSQTVLCEVIAVTSPRTPASNRAVLARYASKHPRLRVIEREPQMRFAAALNLGFRSATAPRIGVLLSDDWLSPDCVETCLRYDADIVSTAYTVFAADGRTRLDAISREHSEAGFQRLSAAADRADYLTHFFLFRRETVAAVGGVDETLGDSPGLDDFDLPWCMLERCASVAIVEERLYNYRDHEGERLTNRKREEMLATFKRILAKHRVEGAQAERLLREHSRWFGRSMLSVYRELEFARMPTYLKPLQMFYRSIVPFQIRLTIGTKLRAIHRKARD